MTLPRGTKRGIEVIESLDLAHAERPATKRGKFSAVGSSATPSPQRSEASALVPTDDEGNLAENESLTSDDHAFNSSGLSTSASSDADCESDGDTDDDDDDDSDLATTSSSSASHPQHMMHDEVDGAGITNLRIGKKPRIRAMQGRRDMLNLRERLSKFLPQMALANAEVEEQRQQGTWDGQGMEDVDENRDDGYIEMVQSHQTSDSKHPLTFTLQNLGLGVLEQKDQEMSDSTSGSASGNDEANAKHDTKESVMARLMGSLAGQDKVGIEEMDTL